MAAWVARWGFAVLVGLAVAAAVFAAAYVASLAFVLALGNRGFSELSASGVKASDLWGEALDKTVMQHDRVLDQLSASVADLEASERRREREYPHDSDDNA